MTEKELFRKDCIIKRNLLSSDEINKKSKLIASSLEANIIYQKSENILLYASYSSEVRTDYIFTKAIEDNKKVYFPKVSNNNMDFFQVASKDDFKSGFKGILEPVSDLKYISEDNSVIIVPGCAFSKDFYRMGYGGGYYDKYLSIHHELYSIGLAFESEMYTKIPTDIYDQKINMIITESKIYKD